MEFHAVVDCAALLGAGTSGKVYGPYVAADGRRCAVKTCTVSSDLELRRACSAEDEALGEVRTVRTRREIDDEERTHGFKGIAVLSG